MKRSKMLRQLRLKKRLTIRDVEAASRVIAKNYGNPRFVIVPSRLWGLETQGTAPNFFCLHALSVIYGRSMEHFCFLFGADPQKVKATRQQVHKLLERTVQLRLTRKHQKALALEQKRQGVLRRKAERKKRQTSVMSLRRQGLTYSEVARRTGLTIVQVNRAVTEAGRAGVRTPLVRKARRRPSTDIQGRFR